MNGRDLKYLLAYFGPASAFLSVFTDGWWTYSAVIFSFVVIPVLDALFPASGGNTPDQLEAQRSSARFFDYLLYLHVPILYGLVACYLQRISSGEYTLLTWLGMTLSVGIYVGASGINIAHELGHRQGPYNRFLSLALLLPALYQHFYIEHNRGHHRHVATPIDPATARKGESLYAFWLRSSLGGWQSAWRIASGQLKRKQQLVWSWSNQMIRFTCYQVGYLAFILIFWGYEATGSAIAIAIVGFLLLESINYIEHYGLLRRQRPNGTYEKVSPAHSWNSNHDIGRIFLYELTRHADHHYKASKKYQVLRHIESSPQLPTGYPAAILIAMIPPLWFSMMDRRLPSVSLLPKS